MGMTESLPRKNVRHMIERGLILFWAPLTLYVLKSAFIGESVTTVTHQY